MSNLFDSSNFPTTEPVELQLGDFWAWKRTDLSTDYPTASYALSYEFNLIDGSTAANFTLTATEANDVYIISTLNTINYCIKNFFYTFSTFRTCFYNIVFIAPN